MSIFLKLESSCRIITEIGSGDLLHSLFSTIACRLEDGQWGARFSVVMGPFYQGAAITRETATEALGEWRDVQAGLAALPPSAVVWDIEQPGIAPPWGGKVESHVTSMANYYITQHGLNLVTDILENLECVVESGGSLQFVSAPSAADVS
jgi:hypothetical protein